MIRGSQCTFRFVDILGAFDYLLAEFFTETR